MQDGQPKQFDFCKAIRELCEDIAIRLPEFRHVDMDQVAVAFAQTRRRVRHGLYAKLTPMRFEQGSLTMQRGRQTWTVQRLYHGAQEMMYILTFYLPRFLDLPYREKLVTIFHELYHISPEFNGDLRRWEGRYFAHSRSQKEYDEQMEVFVDAYLKTRPPKPLYWFLRYRFHTLERQRGSIVGIQIPVPKLIRVATGNRTDQSSVAQQG